MDRLTRLALAALATLALCVAGCSDDAGAGNPGVDVGDRGGDFGSDTRSPVCGDALISGGEVCDASATPTGCAGGQVCNSACTACADGPVQCGNGSLDSGETCDGSSTITGCTQDQVCRSDCSTCDDAASGCGDNSFVAGDEICDGTDTADDGCQPGFECAVDCSQCVDSDVPECGDGAVNGEETCDGSALEDDGCELPNVCDETCSTCEPPQAGCGDGALGEEETCDASSVLDTGCDPPETCNGACTVCEPPAPTCGDGAINGLEACDFSAEPEGCEDGTFCTDECVCDDIPETCGNSALDTDETCDASAAPTGCDEGVSCSADCQECVPADCGDGVVSEAETCDQSAADNGCLEFSVCSDDCTTCSAVCGDLALDEGETCDFDGLFGDPGETCDYDSQYCNSSCECEALALQGVIDAAYTSPIPSADAFTNDDVFSAVWGLDVSITDTDGFETGGFSTFLLLFADADGNVLDFVQGGRDLVLRSEIIGEDPNAYVWRLEFHLLLGVPPDTAFAFLLLNTEDGRPSNLMAVGEFTELAAGDACDDGSVFTQCASNFACVDPAGGAVCTDLGEAAFEQTSFVVTADETADTLSFAFEISDADALGDLVSYWILGVVWDDNPDDTEGPFITATFAGFDSVVDNEDGTFSLSLLVSDASTALGIALGDIIEVGSLVFDTARFDGDIVTPVIAE